MEPIQKKKEENLIFLGGGLHSIYHSGWKFGLQMTASMCLAVTIAENDTSRCLFRKSSFTMSAVFTVSL